MDKPDGLDQDGLHKRGDIWYFNVCIAGTWREKSTRTKNYNEAKARRAQALAARNPLADMGQRTLADVAAEWVKERPQMVSAGMVRIDRERLVPLVRHLGKIKLCKFDWQMIKDYRGIRREKDGVKAKTINLDCETLRSLLRDYKQWDRIQPDYKPLRKERKDFDDPDQVGMALSEEQEKKLFKTAQENPGWQVAYYAALLAINTTQRNAEIRRLQLKHIDLNLRIVRVRYSKTAASTRDIGLNTEAYWALSQLVVRANALGSTGPNHYLLPFDNSKRRGKASTGEGGYDPTRPQGSWRTAWRNLRLAAGLPKNFRFHDLRHTSITNLVEAGVPDQVIRQMAGHVSPEMTQHYTHVRMAALHDAAARISGGHHLTDPNYIKQNGQS